MQNTDKKNNVAIYISNTSLSFKQLFDKSFINELSVSNNITILSTFKFPISLRKNYTNIKFYQLDEKIYQNIYKKKFAKIINFFMQFLYNKKFYNKTLEDFNNIFIKEKMQNKNFFLKILFKFFWNNAQRLFGKFNFLRSLLLKFNQYYFFTSSNEIKKIILINKPNILITSSPGFLNYDLCVINEFKKYKVKILSFLISWDHASGLGFIRSRSDLYLVWGKNSKNDLIKYSNVNSKKIKIVGPLHWKFHFDKKNLIDKEEFYKSNRLDNKKKTILISLKSPTRTNIKEITDFLNKLSTTKLNFETQFIIKPHPINFVKKYRTELLEIEKFCDLRSNFYVTNNYYESNKNQEYISEKNGDLNYQIENLDSENIYNYNLLKHSDLMINFFSTLNIEAAIHGLHSINYIFETQKKNYSESIDRKNLYIDYNQVHNYRLSTSGGTNVCFNFEELLNLIEIKLNNKKEFTQLMDKMIYNEISRDTYKSHLNVLKYINSMNA